MLGRHLHSKVLLLSCCKEILGLTSSRCTCQLDLDERRAVRAERASDAAQLSQPGVHGRSQMVGAPPPILTQATCPCSMKSMQKKHAGEAVIAHQGLSSENEAC